MQIDKTLDLHSGMKIFFEKAEETPPEFDFLGANLK
jgi:hypothetical protein